MSALTGSELVENVKGHLGDRDTGKIGSLAVDEAVRRSLNKALLFISRKFDLPELSRSIEISVTLSASLYAIPTSQSGENFRIKRNSIRSILARKSGEDRELPVRNVDFRTLKRTFGRTSALIQSGRITLYALTGRNIQFHPYPDDSYTVTVDCFIYAPSFTPASLATAHAMGEEWDDVVEFYATYDLWAGLQQKTDADMWYARYREALIEARIAVFGSLEHQTFGRHVLSGVVHADPQHDPLVDSWNS